MTIHSCPVQGRPALSWTSAPFSSSKATIPRQPSSASVLGVILFLDLSLKMGKQALSLPCLLHRDHDLNHLPKRFAALAAKMAQDGIVFTARQ